MLAALFSQVYRLRTHLGKQLVRRRLRFEKIPLQSSRFRALPQGVSCSGGLSMRLALSYGGRWLISWLLLTAFAVPGWGEERAWIPLTGANGLDAWRTPTDGWLLADSVTL